MTENSGGGGNATPVVGIIAAVALVVFFVWFFGIRGSKTPEAVAAPAPQAQTDSNNDVTIKVDLPDSVVIKP